MDENLGKIMIFRGYTKNGSLYYVLECRKCFADFQNAAKKEGQKSENKGFLFPIFVSGDWDFLFVEETIWMTEA